jgi:hypothetical protein
VDFKDAAKYYKVSTVNYLAAGSCNFNDGGVSLWPLDQIVNDTQYYVRDAVIDYVTAMGVVSPAIEGRLAFLNLPAPTIITVSPTQGPAGTVVTITGTGFEYVQSVTVGGRPVQFTVVNPTTITFLMPAEGLSGRVVVTTLGGTATSTVSFTVALTPVITSFSPGAGKVGSTVTIFGNNLAYAKQVTVGGKPAIFKVVSSAMVTATVPSGAVTGKITVTTPYGTATSVKSFYVIP